MFPFSNLFTALSPESGHIFLICNLPSFLPLLSPAFSPPPVSNSYHTQLTKGDCVSILWYPSFFLLFSVLLFHRIFSIFTTTKLCATFSWQKLNTFFLRKQKHSSTRESAALNYINYPSRVLKWVAKFDKLRDVVCCTCFLFVSQFETRKLQPKCFTIWDPKRWRQISFPFSFW